MRGGNANALADALFADNGKNNRLFTVKIIHLVACGIVFVFVEGNKASLFCLFNGESGGLSLCFAGV